MICWFKKPRPAPVAPTRPADNRVDVLFILKRRENYGCEDRTLSQSTGLWNSANYVADMISGQGWRVAVEMAIDNNCIDRLVTTHRPRIVIIEALWVVPDKFAALTKLHPAVHWIVRLHSEMPFMAGEGIALEWMHGYLANARLSLAINAPRMLDDVRDYLTASTMADVTERVAYLPNAYPASHTHKEIDRARYWVDIGCFGAVRPLKNHMVQAIAALKFARAHGKQLRFHINASRMEMKGEPILANLRGMFASLAKYGHQLVEHDWLPRDEFLALCAKMDLGLQVSFSETFNIVAADLTSQGVPVIGSTEIPWLDHTAVADPTDSRPIAEALARAWSTPDVMARANNRGLATYSETSARVWNDFLSDQLGGLHL